jgi:hypothetical protein
MIKKTLAVVMALTALALSSSATDRRNFWILNNTGRTMTSFSVAVHGSSAPWSENALTYTLTNGNGRSLYFTDNSSACVYDFRVYFNDGSYQDYLQGRNLCQTHAVQFNSDTNNAY